jgi:hypothetical protein
LALTLVLSWWRTAVAHGPEGRPGLLVGWSLVAVSTLAGWYVYRAALAGGRPLLWGLLAQLMRMGAILLVILFVLEWGVPWCEPFVETTILGYLCVMSAEVLLLHHSGRA